MSEVKNQNVYFNENTSFVLFDRFHYTVEVEEDRVYEIAPHLTLILGPGYGILVQTLDGEALDPEKIAELSKMGLSAEEAAEEKRAKLQDETLGSTSEEKSEK